MMQKIRESKTWIEVDITPSRYNALAPTIVYVRNAVTISGNFISS